jgi:hypothetical protein
MMKAVLKTLAISFGGGLALGAGIRLTQGSSKSRREPPVDLDPLLERLKNVESRIVEMEAEPSIAPLPPPVPEETLAAFESRLAAQMEDVDQVRQRLGGVDQRLNKVDAQIPAMVKSTIDVRLTEVQSKLQQDFEEARDRSMATFLETLQTKVVEIPAIVQSTVDVRFREVQQKLQQDFEEAQTRSMAAFVDTLQSKVVNRINALESNLSEQSEAIGKLRDTSLRTDESLQKMLAGIERLVEQNRPAPKTPPEPPPVTHPPAPQPAVEPAVARQTVAEQPEELAAHLTQVQQEAATPRMEPLTQRPVLVEVQTIPAPAPAAEVIRTNGKPSLAPAAAGASGQSGPAGESEESFEWVNRIGLELLAPPSKPRLGWRLPLTVGLVVGLILIAGLLYSGVLQRFLSSGALLQTSTLASTSPVADSQASLNPHPATSPQESAIANTKADSLVSQGRDYWRRKDWLHAETAFRSAFEANPTNRDAALGLSDVLYQQQKYEESAAVLNKLSSKPE